MKKIRLTKGKTAVIEAHNAYIAQRKLILKEV